MNNIGFNTMIDELHRNLIDDVNKSKLPVGIVYYVLKDVFSNVSDSYNATLAEEKQFSLQQKDSPQEEEIEDGHQE